MYTLLALFEILAIFTCPVWIMAISEYQRSIEEKKAYEEAQKKSLWNSKASPESERVARWIDEKNKKQECTFPFVRPDQKPPIKDDTPKEETKEEKAERIEEEAKTWIRSNADLITNKTRPIPVPGRTWSIEASKLDGVSKEAKDRIVMLLMETYCKTIKYLAVDPKSGDMVCVME